jgi:hypothetical protein
MGRPNWNMHLLACSAAGAKAREQGKTANCPYKVRAGQRGNLQRQRKIYWLIGWDEKNRELSGAKP